MGIRLYFRNKYKPEDEFCLGKYFSYAEKKDCCYMCVKYLIKSGRIDYFLIDYKEQYDSGDDIYNFLEACAMGRYYEYGEFFEMTTEEACGFIADYMLDRCRLWQYDLKASYMIDILQFIAQNATIESMWEFRLGA